MSKNKKRKLKTWTTLIDPYHYNWLRDLAFKLVVPMSVVVRAMFDTFIEDEILEGDLKNAIEETKKDN